jgi:hypothetical protein
MDDPLTLDRPFMLGLQIGYLSPQPPLICNEIHHLTLQLVQLTQRCGVGTGVFGNLQAKALEWLPHQFGMQPRDVLELHGNTKSIQGHLASELQKLRVVRLIDHNVSPHLKSLETALMLSPAQVALCNETKRCLECGAYRSAIVMGWNTIYDYLRTWIVADSTRLDHLNARLAKIPGKKGKGKRYPKPFATYAELRDSKLEERAFLTHLATINGVDQDCVSDLVRSLNRRNKYAHATQIRDSPHLSNSYIEDLINIAELHFKHDAKASAT